MALEPRGELLAVMLVDDQPPFREAAAAVIRSSPRLVLTAAADCGEAAINILLFDPFDRTGLVLMDINMPGLGGIESTRRLHTIRPELPILLMSTYDVDDLPAEAASCGAVGYLHKEELTPVMLIDAWTAWAAPRPRESDPVGSGPAITRSNIDQCSDVVRHRAWSTRC